MIPVTYTNNGEPVEAWHIPIANFADCVTIADRNITPKNVEGVLYKEIADGEYAYDMSYHWSDIVLLVSQHHVVLVSIADMSKLTLTLKKRSSNNVY